MQPDRLCTWIQHMNILPAAGQRTALRCKLCGVLLAAGHPQACVTSRCRFTSGCGVELMGSHVPSCGAACTWPCNEAHSNEAHSCYTSHHCWLFAQRGSMQLDAALFVTSYWRAARCASRHHRAPAPLRHQGCGAYEFARANVRCGMQETMRRGDGLQPTQRIFGCNSVVTCNDLQLTAWRGALWVEQIGRNRPVTNLEQSCMLTA